MKRTILIAAALLFSGIIIGVVLVSSFSPNMMNDILAEENIGAQNAPVLLNEHAKALNEANIAASNAVIPTVVSISVVLESDNSASAYRDEFREFFEFYGHPFEQPEGKRRSEANGSGVIITDNGYIVTNNHVVENAIEIKVTTNDRKEYKAKLIGNDPLTDLAVIKIDAENLPEAHFEDISNIQIGEYVIAVGNPFGLNHTVTAGIVSAIGRGQLGLGRGGYSVENYIQTDAAINPGNSGGGLFNLNGSLVGINTAIATRTGTYVGYGFAIPVDLVKAVVSDLMDDGKIDRGYIGIYIETVDEVIAKSVGLEDVAGVLAYDIQENSAAEAAGVQPGDIILEVNGEKVATVNDLQSRIAMQKAGDKVELTLWREGKEINKTVTLKSKDDAEDIAGDIKNDEPAQEEEKQDKSKNFENLGFSVEPLSAKIKDEYNVKKGVFISDVQRYSVAANRRLMPNGVITKANRKSISSTGELSKIINGLQPGETVLLYVKYKDINRIVALEIPEK